MRSSAQPRKPRRLTSFAGGLIVTAVVLGAAAPIPAAAADWTTHLISAPTGGSADLPTGGDPYTGGQSMSPDGKTVAFATAEQLVPADSNADADVYERVGGVTRLISAGPGGVAAGGARPVLRADRVYFDTNASLVPEDTDGGTWDVYVYFDGDLSLVSAPGAGATGPDEDTNLEGVSGDGSTAVIATIAHLTGDDDDACLCQDLFERSRGTTRLVSAPSGGTGDHTQPSGFGAISVDGARIFFQTRDSMTPDDVDGACPPPGPFVTGCSDIYEWHDGTTQLVSAPQSTTPTPAGVYFVNAYPDRGATPDGTHFFFVSDDSLVPGEPAGLYERFNGQTRLVSAPEPGGSAGGRPLGGPYFNGVTPDGSKVFFNTPQSLVPEDTDGGNYDLYERSNGVTTLVSLPGPGADPEPSHAYFGGMSRDGSHLFFYADGPFTTNDTNSRPLVDDVFERSNGETTLVTGPSPGNPSGGGEFVGSSADGSRVFFAAEGGIYERSNGVTTFVSAPGPGGVSDPHPQTFNFGAISDDGTRIMWLSSARMTVADTDDRIDLYQAVLDDTEPAPASGVAGAVSSPPGVHIERVAWPKTVRKLISKGVRVLVSCDSECKLSLSVRARKAVDGLAKGAEIAHGKGSVGGGQDRWLTAKLTRTAARAFGAHAGKLDFSRFLRATVTSR